MYAVAGGAVILLLDSVFGGLTQDLDKIVLEVFKVNLKITQVGLMGLYWFTEKNHGNIQAGAGFSKPLHPRML